jgi:hypothetical protein
MIDILLKKILAYLLRETRNPQNLIPMPIQEVLY